MIQPAIWNARGNTATIAQTPNKKDINLVVDSDHVLLISPSRGWVSLDLGSIWKYRELLYFLTWRNIKVRYKQTVLGSLWAVLQPISMMLVFSVFFGRLVGVPSEGFPYPVFVFVGLLPWQIFAYALSEAGNSLVVNQQLITKVYFPRLLIPLSTVLAALVDFFVTFIVLLALVLYYRITPTLAILALPIFIVFALITAFAVGLWISALNVQYRDFRYVIPFLTQFWLFATPIAYPSSLIPEQWRALYGLNPMAGVVEGFRWSLLGKVDGNNALIMISAGLVIVLLASGLIYFRQMEKTFADVV